MDRFSQLCEWSEQSRRVCSELMEVLDRERTALILLKSDELVETTASKDMLTRRLVGLRNQIRDGARAWYGADSSAKLLDILPPHQRPEWEKHHKAWAECWSNLEMRARQGQKFLQHSGNNLSRFVDHWRRLLGDTPTYSAQGRKVESASTGKVFEAKY
ncbi:hypothetical protein K2X33_14475 [bacterium]|nr:hypothetical protein [bacterium]